MPDAGPGQGGVPAIDTAAVAPEAFLLDVREPDEWAAGHAPGALHIPLGSLPERVEEVPADRTVVVTCRSGGRSARATAFLGSIGRDAVNLEGGMQAWVAQGREIVTESSGRPSII